MKTNELPKFGPLQGVRVVHMTSAIAGPFANTILADLGADVIGIENPSGRDPSRPFAHMRGMGQELDRRNSRALCLDVVSPEGRKAFYELLKTTDILMEAYRGGQLQKWGMSDEELWKVNPKLVITHISGYGQTGLPEYVNRASFDGIGQAFSGFMSMNGFPDRDPVLAFPQVSDYYSGFMADVASLAALHRAQITGKGESIDVSQVEAMIRCTGFYIMRLMNEGIAPTREGSHSTTSAGYGCYKCGDGESVYFLILGPKNVKNCLEMLGLEYGGEMFPKTLPWITTTYKYADVFEKALNDFCMSHTSYEVEKLIQERENCPAPELTLWRTPSPIPISNPAASTPNGKAPTMKSSRDPRSYLFSRTTPGRSGAACRSSARTTKTFSPNWALIRTTSRISTTRSFLK